MDKWLIGVVMEIGYQLGNISGGGGRELREVLRDGYSRLVGSVIDGGWGAGTGSAIVEIVAQI